MATKSTESVGIRLDNLTVADRCDKCGAQAYVTVALLHGDLMFCAHDFRIHEASIMHSAVGILDERDLLLSDQS